MGGRGASSGGGGGGGVSSTDFFKKDMTEQVKYFESQLTPKLERAFTMYSAGVVGGDLKATFDSQMGMSEFIDSDASKPLRVTNNPTLYRGGTISDAEYQNLKVGETLDAMDSKNQLTSWSDREMVAHMYAEQSKSLWGQGGSNSHDIVIVDTSKTNDGIVMPYTYPHNEIVRSKKMSYKITKIVDETNYSKPIGREKELTNDYYKKPVTYVYVKSIKSRK